MRNKTVDGAFGSVEFAPFTGENGNEPASEAEIAAIEASIDRRLPADYRDYLATINGGTVEPRGVPYRWNAADLDVLKTFLSPQDDIIAEPVALVAELYAVRHPNRNIDLHTALGHVLEWGRPGLLPIAATSTGDFIVLDLDEGESHGSVYYMTIHGVAALAGTGHSVPLAYIAPSFTSFAKLFFDFDNAIDARVQALLGEHRP